jgi:hypothetical protein
MLGDILYCNSGDWVESLTALVEDHDGKLSVLRFTDMHENARLLTRAETIAEAALA